MEPLAVMNSFAYDIDIRGRTLTILGTHPIRVPLPEHILPPNQTHLEHIAVRPHHHRATLALPGAVEATIELGIGLSPAASLDGRRIVYLDQNHWSTVSDWRVGGGRLSAANAAAAKRLLELADDGRIILPLSGAHLVETTPLFGTPRVARAGTLLSASRGWQMRNPVHVRREELTRGLDGTDEPRAREVFALNVDDVFTSRRSTPDFPDLPSEVAAIGSELVPALAIAEALIEPDAIPDQGGQAAASAWAAKFAHAAEQLRLENPSPRRVRQVGYAMFMADLADELVVIARDLRLGVHELLARLSEKGERLQSMPYLSRLRDVLTLRMGNTGQKWEANHLVDLNFLSCAAGYADVVIGERQTIDYLSKVRVAPPGAQLAKTLPEGVELVEALLA